MNNLDSGHATKQDFEYLSAIEERLKKNPNDVNTLIEKGFLYIEPFHWSDGALAIFRQAVALDKTNVDAYFWLAKSLYHDHFEEQEAKKFLEIALTIDPDRADCHDLLASVLNTLGEDSDKSIEHLKKVIALEPSWILPRIALSYYFLEKKNIEQAEQIAIEAKKIYENMVLPKPTTPIQEYYEECITGRTTQRKNSFTELFKKINEQKTSISKA